MDVTLPWRDFVLLISWGSLVGASGAVGAAVGFAYESVFDPERDPGRRLCFVFDRGLTGAASGLELRIGMAPWNFN